MTRNVAASIRARLKTHADASGGDFDLTLTRFALERLLYRLSISQHADQFLLKGALLFSLWFESLHRPTRDADLLGYGQSDLKTVANKFREIVSIAGEDGIEFDVKSVSASDIRKQDGYGGARITIQVDVGFGDAVVPAPDSVTYPVLLSDQPAPKLRAYPKYTVIAEKLHAICLLGMTNSRMKDYFDLYVLASDRELDLSVIADAITATFERRKTALSSDWPLGLTAEFANNPTKRMQWKAFLDKNRLYAPSLETVVDQVRGFLDAPMSRARQMKDAKR